MSRKRVINLPKKATTFAKRARDGELWGYPETLADILESLFEELRDEWGARSNIDLFIHYLAKTDSIKEFSSKHYLSAYHIAYTLVTVYL